MVDDDLKNKEDVDGVEGKNKSLFVFRVFEGRAPQTGIQKCMSIRAGMPFLPRKMDFGPNRVLQVLLANLRDHRFEFEKKR